jgi:DNA-binding transcriptional MerR regulator
MLKEKSETALRTIGEVADDLDLPQHVLRFWETKFAEIEPVKRAGGRRYYRPRDVELLVAIRHLLYGEGYTIKGVQRMLKDQGARAVVEGAAASLRSGEETPHRHVDESADDRDGSEKPRAFGYGDNEPSLFPAAPSPGGEGSKAEATLSEECRHRLFKALDQIAECKRLLTLTRR